MARYIDADALLNKVERYFAGLPIVVHHDMVEYIENAPTAYVVERKRGKWKDFTMGRWVYAQCSVCGTVHDTKTQFCPNCGAQMG